MHVVLQIYMSREMDIEQPEYLSPADTELVYMGHQFHSGSLLQSVVTLPIHLRYHRPGTHDGYVKVNLSSPAVSLACSGMTPASGILANFSTFVGRLHPFDLLLISSLSLTLNYLASLRSLRTLVDA